MDNKIDQPRISILVTTCAAFSDLWENYLFLINKYWPAHPKIVFVSDGVPEKYRSLPISFLSFEGNYSSRLKQALLTLETQYVFLTLDDYLLCGPVNEATIEKLISIMDSNQLHYCRLYHRSKTKPWFNKKLKLKSLPLTEKSYEVNLYTSIWNVDSLINLIQKDEDPWKFEVRLTRRCNALKYKCIACIDKAVYPFIDTVRKGKYLRKAFRFLKKNKLFISNRKVRTIKEEFILWIRTIVSRALPKTIHDWLMKNTKIRSISRFRENDD